jgi:hypothetical protein
MHGTVPLLFHTSYAMVAKLILYLFKYSQL